MPPGTVRIERRSRARDEGHQNADGHGGVHTHPATHEVAPGTAEKRATGKKHHRQAQHPTGPTQQLVNVRGNLTRRGHVGGPCVHHDLHGAETGHEQTPQRTTGFAQTFADGQRLLHRQQPVAGLSDHLRQAGHAGQGRVPAHGQASCGGMHLGKLHTGQILQCAFNRVGTRRAIHALHHQHRLRHLVAIDFGKFGEILLFDRIVQNSEIVGDGERAPVRAKQTGRSSALTRLLDATRGRRIAGQGTPKRQPHRGRGDGLVHALRVIQQVLQALDLSQPLRGGLC
ncbi:hypothetical protein Y695_02511 [Hydrogenophaga sp. T4]|nr:hypothetical protein Y695_02511 [Hydrogenophaga sp. T4]